MAAPKILTEAEYFAADHASDSRLEFFDGKIIDARAMAGGAYTHSLISSNIAGALGQALKGSPCRAHGSDLRVGLPSGRFFYPDALVECGRPQLRDEGPSDTLTNPVAVYEVLSASSARYDAGPKKNAYVSVPSIKEIVLVHMSSALVESYIRDDQGWRWEATVGLGSTLRTVGVEIPMSEIYAGVAFPEDGMP